MSRLAIRRLMTVVAASLAALVAPAAAHAAAYTVAAGGGLCGGADLACGTLADAATAAAPGDTFAIAAGEYAAAVFDDAGIQLNGAPGVIINGTLQFTAAAGDSPKISKAFVTQATGAAPAVLVTGAAGAIIEDVVAFSQDGDAIHISAGTTNKIVRTLAVTGGAQTSAVRIKSTPATPPKGVALESAMLIGGKAGIGATTESAEIETDAGDITISARHITAAGSTHGVELDSSQSAELIGAGTGNITMTMTDSITLDNRLASFDGLLGGDNVASLAATRSLLTGDRAAIFADAPGRDFRLRPGSPAIGQGALEPDESTTDIDGEARKSPSDLGADEFYNAPPVARIIIRTGTPRNAQPVTFDGSGSADREARYGGGIAAYNWRFSDGTTQSSASPTITKTFANVGDATASLVVVDRQGAASGEVTVPLKLTDGVAPVVAIAKPKRNQTLRVFTTTTRTVTRDGKRVRTTSRKRTKLSFGGLSRDESGMQRILLTLEKITSTTSRSRCFFFNPSRGVTRTACSKPVLISARLVANSTTGEWVYNVRRNLSAGSYRLSAFGVDKAGAFGNSAPASARVIRFRLR